MPWAPESCKRGCFGSLAREKSRWSTSSVAGAGGPVKPSGRCGAVLVGVGKEGGTGLGRRGEERSRQEQSGQEQPGQWYSCPLGLGGPRPRPQPLACCCARPAEGRWQKQPARSCL
jgi:hypothetical protein